MIVFQSTLRNYNATYTLLPGNEKYCSIFHEDNLFTSESAKLEMDVTVHSTQLHNS